MHSCEVKQTIAIITPLDEAGELGLGGAPPGVDVHVVAGAVDVAVLAGLEALTVGGLGAEGAIGGGGRLEDLAGIARGKRLQRCAHGHGRQGL